MMLYFAIPCIHRYHFECNNIEILNLKACELVSSFVKINHYFNLTPIPVKAYSDNLLNSRDYITVAELPQQFELLEQKISELTTRYKKLQEEYAELRAEVETTTKQRTVLRGKHRQAVEQIRTIIANLQSVSEATRQ